jgi:hypothetical protein
MPRRTREIQARIDAGGAAAVRATSLADFVVARR